MCIVQHGYYPMQLLSISVYWKSLQLLISLWQSFKLVGSLIERWWHTTQLHDFSPADVGGGERRPTSGRTHVKQFQDLKSFLRINILKNKNVSELGFLPKTEVGWERRKIKACGQQHHLVKLQVTHSEHDEEGLMRKSCFLTQMSQSWNLWFVTKYILTCV